MKKKLRYSDPYTDSHASKAPGYLQKRFADRLKAQREKEKSEEQSSVVTLITPDHTRTVPRQNRK